MGYFSESLPAFWAITGIIGVQNLTITNLPRFSLTPGIYTVTVSANTNMSDAGCTFINTANLGIQIGGASGFNKTITSTATASVAICIHGSSMIELSNGQQIEIFKIKSGGKLWVQIIK